MQKFFSKLLHKKRQRRSPKDPKIQAVEEELRTAMLGGKHKQMNQQEYFLEDRTTKQALEIQQRQIDEIEQRLSTLEQKETSNEKII